MRYCLAAAFLLLIGCGPSCPRRSAHRADPPPDRTSGEQRIVLEANVLAQQNAYPATLLVRVAGFRPERLHFSVHDEASTLLLEVDVSPGPEGLYRIPLALPGGKTLGTGIYRLHVAPAEPLEGLSPKFPGSLAGAG